MISLRLWTLLERIFLRMNYVTDTNYEAVLNGGLIKRPLTVLDGYFLNIHQAQSDQPGQAAIQKIRRIVINHYKVTNPSSRQCLNMKSIACIHHRIGDFSRLRPQMILSDLHLRKIVSSLQSNPEISQIRIHTESLNIFRERHDEIGSLSSVQTVSTPTAEEALAEFVICSVFVGNKNSSMSTLAYLLRGEDPRRVSSCITVLLPVHSKNIFSTHLREALSSIACQTVLPHEVILAVNGSTHSDTEYYRKEFADYIKETVDPPFRIKILTLPQASVSIALNKAIAESSTQWLMRMDDDDLMTRDRIEATEAIIKGLRPGQELLVPFIYSSAIIRKPEGKHRVGYKLMGGKMLPLFLRLGFHPICHPTTTLNRLAIYKYPRIRYIEDYALWWRLLRRQSLKPMFISKPLLIYNHIPCTEKESGNLASLIRCNRYRKLLLTKNFELLLIPRIIIDSLRISILKHLL